MTNKPVNFRRNYMLYILDCLSDEDKFINKKPSALELCEYALNRFDQEGGHNIKKMGLTKAVEEWLRGLPLATEYNPDGILNLALKLGRLTQDEYDNDEQKCESILEEYYPYIAKRFVEVVYGTSSMATFARREWDKNNLGGE